MKKYPLEQLLLYLDNQLPDDQSQEISAYLTQNPELLQYLIELSKVKTYSESKANKILFDGFKQELWFHCSGLVVFLQEQRLAFRGIRDLQSYQYAFLDLHLNFLCSWDDTWHLQLESPNNDLYCELLSDDLTFIFQKKVRQVELISLAITHTYYLFVHSYQDIKILEISL